jgi:guanine nucleotide-binding protein alpha-1 subunit
MQPPEDETPQQLAERRRRSLEAREKSKRIDETLVEDKKVYDRKSRAVKVLLLGECGSRDIFGTF